MRHVVMFSGGIGSWAAAKRVVERHGTDDLTLLFTDTRMEDEDLYRFLREAAANVGGELVILRDPNGRDVWDVLFERGWINHRYAWCSYDLKQRPANEWLAENCDPADTTVYIGIDWTEAHRYERIREIRAAEGWRYEAPLCEPPYLAKDALLDWLRSEGIEPPRLYAMGFAHNNCGGFCIKAGQGHFANLLRTMPDRYAHHETKEEAFRAMVGEDVAILRDRTGGTTTPLTLRELRERIEGGGQCDMFDIGGCGCFVDVDDDDAPVRAARRGEGGE